MIVEKNLYGLDIDERAYQIAYFSIMMKARKYDRRFLTREVSPNLFYPKVDKECIEIGSLLLVDNLEEMPIEPEIQTLFDLDYEDTLNDWNFKRLLTNKYTIICTNPPYMNASYMPIELKKYVEKEYKDYKSDLFSAFMAREIQLCEDDGYVGMLTPYVWMFISSYEKLRTYMLNNTNFSSLVQLEYNAFEGACVPVCAFVLEKTKEEKYGEYIKLSDFKGIDVQAPKTLEAIHDLNCKYRYSTIQSDFKKIPCTPIAYWLSEQAVLSFSYLKLKDYGSSKQGATTSDNVRFLRRWYEVDTNLIGYGCSSTEDASLSAEKWFPYNKGGKYRKWYGNNEYLINYENNGSEIKAFHEELNKTKPGGRLKNQEFYFKESITYTFIAVDLSCRFSPQGAIFDVSGSSIFAKHENIFYLLALLSSKLSKMYLDAINPSMNMQTSDISNIPVIISNEYESIICNIADANINISKTDWDGFETSWDFDMHPLVKNKIFANEYHQGENYSPATIIQDSYAMWHAQTISQFEQLKSNEEELNRIFIEIYGLQDELTPEVEDKDVTVHLLVDTKESAPESMRKSPYLLTKQDAIKSLISYAVGCMFGRYSLDVDGLAYAGGEFDSDKYKTFTPDKDNVIPICDDEYFEDDIVGRFIEFVKTVYGEQTLEQNLDFIANALGGKGTAREVIRNYFLNNFYKDHCQTYKKRPIYWQLDSGKKNGFKALIYMHRYEQDTIARVRTDYVHEQQGRYHTAIADLESRIINATTSDRVKLSKQLSKLKDQEIETRVFEEKIHHLADQMIRIDLDDGVKNNYEIFKDVLSKIK